MSHRSMHMQSHAMHIKGKLSKLLIFNHIDHVPIISVKYGNDSYRLQSLQLC